VGFGSHGKGAPTRIGIPCITEFARGRD